MTKNQEDLIVNQLVQPLYDREMVRLILEDDATKEGLSHVNLTPAQVEGLIGALRRGLNLLGFAAGGGGGNSSIAGGGGTVFGEGGGLGAVSYANGPIFKPPPGVSEISVKASAGSIVRLKVPEDGRSLRVTVNREEF